MPGHLSENDRAALADEELGRRGLSLSTGPAASRNFPRRPSCAGGRGTGAIFGSVYTIGKRHDSGTELLAASLERRRDFAGYSNTDCYHGV